MSDQHINFDSYTNKESKYIQIIPQIESLLRYETDRITALSNVTAILKECFNFFWVGFYVVNNDILSLYPFQGTMACSKIKYGKGVCGASWEQKRTLIVKDVREFEGHIACSSLSLSEIVVPLIKNDTVIAVLDIDSDKVSSFDNIDACYLEQITNLVIKYCF